LRKVRRCIFIGRSRMLKNARRYVGKLSGTQFKFLRKIEAGHTLSTNPLAANSRGEKQHTIGGARRGHDIQ